MKVSELLDGIKKQDLVLPEFQREYVWNRETAKQLLLSMLKQYPVGGLLFWKTDNPPDLKNVEHLPEKLGTIHVVLDGQQRLTTLYLLMEGAVPRYYQDSDITNDPRDLYYNVGTGDLQYYLSSTMKGDPIWIRVITCFQSFQSHEINVFRIARERAETDSEALDLAQKYNDNLTKLCSVQERDLPVQSVPYQASLDEAIDIFDRVNSKGTKLSDSELALTHIVGKWSQARKVMKAKIVELEKHNFSFDLKFMTRALNSVVTRRALFPAIHEIPKEELETGWHQLDKILDYSVSMLRNNCFVHSTEDLPTTNVLVPWVAYLSKNGGVFPSADERRLAQHWLYVASMWSRYTSQTDQKLEHDLSLIAREASPWSELIAAVIEQRGRIEVKPSDLEGRGAQHPFYRMTYVIAKAHGAFDWFNGLPLGDTYGDSYKIHSHHIFPRSVLYKAGYEKDNHLHRKIVNEIANRAFLTANSNMDLAASEPAIYIPKVLDQYPDALERQFVPVNEPLWKAESFDAFLAKRRDLIAKAINDYLEKLASQGELVSTRSVEGLIKLPESATLEFKSTLQWDVVENQENKGLRQSVLKTIAAFLNSEGGSLIIGVEDDGQVYGLRKDFELLGGEDGFGKTLTNLVASSIGPEFGHLMAISFHEADGEKVCMVEVKPSGQPAYLDGPKGKQFFTRFGNTTRPLDPEETVDYIGMKWG